MRATSGLGKNVHDASMTGVDVSVPIVPYHWSSAVRRVPTLGTALAGSGNTRPKTQTDAIASVFLCADKWLKTDNFFKVAPSKTKERP
jgi:hypothetical protein